MANNQQRTKRCTSTSPTMTHPLTSTLKLTTHSSRSSGGPEVQVSWNDIQKMTLNDSHDIKEKIRKAKFAFYSLHRQIF
jgi:hypothetical protein